MLIFLKLDLNSYISKIKKTMKKTLFLFTIVLSMTLANAQSNLTLVISEKVEKGYFKQESYKWNVQGLASSANASTFLTNIKKDTNIKTASIAADATRANEYTFIFSVNKIYDKNYFEKVMYNNGVRFAMINGKLETLKAPLAAAAK